MDSHNTKENSKRLHIIGANEVVAIFDLPWFTTEDQANYFSLSAHSSQLLLQKQGCSNLDYTFLGEYAKIPILAMENMDTSAYPEIFGMLMHFRTYAMGLELKI